MRDLNSIAKWRGQAATVAIIALCGASVFAQTTHTEKSSDPFATYHDSLSRTADRVLATPFQRAESKAPESSTTVEPGAKSTEAKGRTAAITRVQQLQPVIEPILRDEQLPAELTAIVLVESGGRPNALSPKGARGIWQFMPDTARRYGLTVTPQLDERVDVHKSTRAAARYLRDLHDQFGDWRLAFAAYNAGGDAVQRAITRNGAIDFGELGNSRSLPMETRRYVPAVLNAMKIFGKASSLVAPGRSLSASWIVYAGSSQTVTPNEDDHGASH